MSYMILMKNCNGAIIATDTRLLTTQLKPQRKSERGKKLLFSQPLKFAISILGATSYQFSVGTHFFHFYLEGFINNVVHKNIAFYQNRTLPQIIAGFLSFIVQNNLFTLSTLQECETIFSGIHFKNGRFETIDFNLQDILAIVFNPTGIHIPTLETACNFQITAPNQAEIITGGDHILAWVAGQPNADLPVFMMQYKQAIQTKSLDTLRNFTIQSMQSIIQSNYDISIGGSIDYVVFDIEGNIIDSNITNPNLLTYADISVDYLIPENIIHYSPTQGRKAFKSLHQKQPIAIEKQIQRFIDAGQTFNARDLYLRWNEMKRYYPNKRKLKPFIFF